jgi:hypothetical protein
METPQQVLETIASTNRVAKAELERMKTELRLAYAERAKSRAAMFRVCESADAVLTNEEHAFSGGMRTYKAGSPTWETYDNLRQATQSAYQTSRAPIQNGAGNGVRRLKNADER